MNTFARIAMKSSMFFWKKYKKEDVEAYQNRVETQMSILNDDRTRMADRLNQLEGELELWKSNVYNKGQDAEMKTEYTKQIMKTREERLRGDFEKELLRVNNELNNILLENDQRKVLNANQKEQIKELDAMKTKLQVEYEFMKQENERLQQENKLLRDSLKDFEPTANDEEVDEEDEFDDVENPFYELFWSDDIFPTQREFGENIVSKLVDKQIVHALVYAPTQAGKTGAALSVAYFSQDPRFAKDLKIPPENIFLLTGLSATSWSAQTQSRFPEFMSSKILHLQDVMKFTPPKKDVLILIDEMHIACKKDQTLHKFMKSSNFSSYDYCMENNIKFVHISATPEGAWHSILPGHRAVIPMIPKKDSGYIGVKTLIATNQVKQCRNLITQNSGGIPTEDTISNIQELVQRIRSYDEPKFHIIRCPCPPTKSRTPKKEKQEAGGGLETPDAEKKEEQEPPLTADIADDVEDEPQEIKGLQMVVRNIQWVCKEIMGMEDDFFVYEENPSIEVIQKMLGEIKPRKHILIFIKNGGKCAVTFNKLHLGVLYDRYTTQSKDAIQMRFFSRNQVPSYVSETTEIVLSQVDEDVESFKNIKYKNGEYYCIDPEQWMQRRVTKKGRNAGRSYVVCFKGGKRHCFAFVDELDAAVNKIKLAAAREVDEFSISKTAVKNGTARESFVVQSLLGRATGYPKSAEERSAMEKTTIYTDLFYVRSYIRDTYKEFEKVSPSLGSAYPHVGRYMDDSDEEEDPDEDTLLSEIGRSGAAAEEQEHGGDVRRGPLFA